MEQQQIKELRKGMVICHKDMTNADGTKRRYKITSIKTWKTRPDILVGLKRGLYEYHKVNENDLITLFDLRD
jgi:hypothetical protein